MKRKDKDFRVYEVHAISSEAVATQSLRTPPPTAKMDWSWVQVNKLKQGEICSESELEIISTFGTELELSDYDSFTSEAENCEVSGDLAGNGFSKRFPFPKIIDHSTTPLSQRIPSPMSDSMGSYIAMDRVSSITSRISFKTDLPDNASISSNSSQILSELDLQQILAELAVDSLDSIDNTSQGSVSCLAINSKEVSTDPVLDSLILASPSTPTERSVYLESLDRKKLESGRSETSPEPEKRFDPLEFLRDILAKSSFQSFASRLKIEAVPRVGEELRDSWDILY